MKRVIAVASVGLVVGMASVAGAQQPKPATPDPHGHTASPSASAPAQTPAAPSGHGAMPMAMCMDMMRAGGMMGGGMMGHHGGMGGPGAGMGHHGAMGGPGAGMMGGPMMGMGMSGAPTDPKTMSQMMEMRGEMMKAMGDIMMKHAQKMRAADTPAKK